MESLTMNDVVEIILRAKCGKIKGGTTPLKAVYKSPFGKESPIAAIRFGLPQMAMSGKMESAGATFVLATLPLSSPFSVSKMPLAVSSRLLKCFRELYPESASSDSLLPPGEEQALFARRADLREELRSLLLDSDFVLQRLLRAVRDVLEGKKRFGAVFLATNNLNTTSLRNETTRAEWMSKLVLAERRLARVRLDKDRPGIPADETSSRIAPIRSKMLAFLEDWQLRDRWWESEIESLETTRSAFHAEKQDIDPSVEQRWEHLIRSRSHLAALAETTDALDDRIRRAKEIHARLSAVRNRLIEGKLFFTLRVAKYFQDTRRDYRGLIQDCCLALVRVVDAFVPTEKNSFDSYATRTIFQQVGREEFGGERTIRIPVVRNATVRRIESVLPSRPDIEHRYGYVEELFRQTSLPEKELIDYLNVLQSPTDLQSRVIFVTNDGRRWKHAVPWPPEHFVAKNDKTFPMLCRDEFHEVLLDISTSWSARELQIIVLRFGLQGEDEKTPAKVAAIAKLPREQVWRLEWQVLRRMRSLSVAQRLVGFLD